MYIKSAICTICGRRLNVLGKTAGNTGSTTIRQTTTDNDFQVVLVLYQGIVFKVNEFVIIWIKTLKKRDSFTLLSKLKPLRNTFSKWLRSLIHVFAGMTTCLIHSKCDNSTTWLAMGSQGTQALTRWPVYFGSSARHMVTSLRNCIVHVDVM